MSIVRINALHITEGQGDEFLKRFSARPHKIEHAEGFESFQVLRPSDERSTWLVITTWRDAEAYDTWHAGRPPRDPGKVTYADAWEVWSYDLLENVTPAPT